MAAEKKCIIIIPVDQNKKNAAKEQFRIYQKDNVTVQVAIGVKQEVDPWVAELALKVGDITDYIVL